MSLLTFHHNHTLYRSHRNCAICDFRNHFCLNSHCGDRKVLVHLTVIEFGIIRQQVLGFICRLDYTQGRQS